MKKNQKIQMVEIMTFLTLLTTLIKCTQSSPYSINTNPFLPPGNLTASPLGNLTASTACHLDLSSELFGGVSAACSSSPLSLTRCCPVLAAWLFAAHATSALAAVPPSTNQPSAVDDGGPMVPENESQKCVDKLEESLKSKNIRWTPRVNDTCDTVLCYCGIRLHQISSLSCPANMFNVTAAGGGGNNNKNGSVRLVKPMGGVKELERECKNASFFGCSRCLHSLQKLKGEGKGKGEGGGERAKKMFDRDCQLMGLTWLLAKNKSLYIPTVSAVLRALLYSSSHAKVKEYSYKCSPDQENMPLAVDSLQFQHMLDSTTSSSSSSSSLFLATLHVMLLVLVGLF